MEDLLERHVGLGMQADMQLDARYARYAEHRAAAAVAWEPALSAWCVYRYAEAKRVLEDAASFAPGHRTDREGPHREMAFAAPIGTGARHDALRRALAEGLADAAVARLEPRVRSIAREHLTPALARGHFDLVGEVAHPLAVTVVAELLGVPIDERPRYRRLADAVLLGTETGRLRGLPPPAEAVAARRELDAWVAAERRKPGRAAGDDLFAALLAGPERLSDADLFTACALVLAAGHATTVHLVTNAVYCLLRFPEARDRLLRDPSGLPDAVEEVLRWLGPAQEVTRRATRAVALGGAEIAEGQRVVAWIGSANRDERVFSEPDRFDATRRPNPHLAFGAGGHDCVGAPLARLQARVVLDALLDRLDHLRPSEEDPPRLEVGSALVGFSRFVLERV